MRKWGWLVTAILLEVGATLSLRGALDRPALYAVVLLGYLGSFAAMTMLLRAGMALGVAYGIWGASGVALTAVLAAVIFGDPLTVIMAVGIVLVIGGVLCVELGAQAAASRSEPGGEERGAAQTAGRESDDGSDGSSGSSDRRQEAR